MKHRTGLCHTGSFWTGPCRAKPSPASPNHVKSALFWDITQCRAVIPHRHFVTTHWSQLQMSRNPKDRTQHNRKLTQFSFLGLWQLPISWGRTTFRKPARFPFSGKDAPNLVDPLDSGHCRNSNLLRYVSENRSSPMVANRKIPTEKLIINYKTQKYNVNRSTN